MLQRLLRKPNSSPPPFVQACERAALRDISYIRKGGERPYAFLAHPSAFHRLVSADAFTIVGLPVVECSALNEGAVWAVTENEYLRVTKAEGEVNVQG